MPAASTYQDMRHPDSPKLATIQGTSGPATISPIEAPDPTVPVARPRRRRENHCPIMACAGMLAMAVPKPASSRPNKAVRMTTRHR